jgi:PHD/YefM family antitoxin component YafN of YafNO toxin-antitoxin module
MYYMYVMDTPHGTPTPRVSAALLQRQWGKVQDMALAGPVMVTCKGRDRMVLLSAEEYHRLKRRDRQVLALTDFTARDIEAIERAQAPAEAAAFNHEASA